MYGLSKFGGVSMNKNWKNFTKPSKDALKNLLSKEDYFVTQKNGTEPPFTGKYWNSNEEGIYIDKVSGEPLFSSKEKFDSGCGWPSFTNPIDKNFVVEKEDYSNFMERVEIRSKIGDSHLGHVFDDGPLPFGRRYCLNSASLIFIPKSKMKEAGYQEYLKIFD